MRFLADENVEVPVVRALGHDVAEVGVRSPGAEDEDAVTLARRQDRILMTNDKDFGDLVFLQQRVLPGVLLRLPGMSGRAKAPLVAGAVKALGSRLENHFVVVEPDRARLRPLRA